MLIKVLSIGRLGKGAEKALCDDYQARARSVYRQLGIRDIAVEEFRESQQRTAAARQDEEGALLLSRLASSARVIVLDERGKTLSSRDFATSIQESASRGLGEIAFLIGGPDGHGDKLRQRADRLLAFGAMTLPHKLLRVVLLEQLYRAGTILTNHPYHRD